MAKTDVTRLWYPCSECGDHRLPDDIEVISTKAGQWEGSIIVEFKCLICNTVQEAYPNSRPWIKHPGAKTFRC